MNKIACKYSDPLLSAVNHIFDLHSQEIILDVYLINELFYKVEIRNTLNYELSAFFPIKKRNVMGGK